MLCCRGRNLMECHCIPTEGSELELELGFPFAGWRRGWMKDQSGFGLAAWVA